MDVHYSERLWVPVSWWVIGLFFSLTFVSAAGVYLSVGIALAGAIVAAVGVSAALLWYGRTPITVDGDGVHAGAALLEWNCVGETVVHDRAGTRTRLGAGADPAAWLVVRGYVPDSLEIAVDDPTDAHPYWLVSTRRPQELADAIAAARLSRTTSGEASGNPGKP